MHKSYITLIVLVVVLLCAVAGDEPQQCTESIDLDKGEQTKIDKTGINLKNGTKCQISLSHNKNRHRISLIFQSVNFQLVKSAKEDPPPSEVEECTTNYVKFAKTEAELKEASKYCKLPTNPEIMVNSKQVFIEYFSTEVNQPSTADVGTLGFVAIVKLVPPEVDLCHQQLTITNDSPTTINRTGDQLDVDTNCQIKITSADSKYKLALDFQSVQFEETEGKCEKDFVRIAKGDKELLTAPKYCNTPTPTEQLIDGSSGIVEYHVSAGLSDKSGFLVNAKRVNASNHSQSVFVCYILTLISTITVRHAYNIQ